MPPSAWLLTLQLCLQQPATVPPSAPAPAPTPVATADRAVEQPDARPLSRIVQNLGRDLRATTSLTTLAIASVGAAGALAASPADDDLELWARQSGRASYTDAGSTLGDGWVQGTAALTTYAIGRLTGSAELREVGSDLIRVQVLNGVITQSLKYGIDRARPGGGHLAFPSGHTSATFASASVLHARYGWKTGLAAYSAASFVGWSRVRDRKHWLSDVIVGGAIGILSGRAVTSGRGSSSWTFAPVATSDGVGVVVSRHPIP